MYRYALMVFLGSTLAAVTFADAAPIQFKRGIELIESYRELLPSAFAQESRNQVLSVWNNTKNHLPQRGIVSDHTASAVLANHILADRICGLTATRSVSDFKDLDQYARHFWGRPLEQDEVDLLAPLAEGLLADGLAEERRFQTLCTLFCNGDAFITHP